MLQLAMPLGTGANEKKGQSLFLIFESEKQHPRIRFCCYHGRSRGVTAPRDGDRERDPYVRIRLHRMRSVRKAPDDGATRRQMPEVRHPQRAGCNLLLIVRRSIRRPRRPRIESRRQSEDGPIEARRSRLDVSSKRVIESE